MQAVLLCFKTLLPCTYPTAPSLENKSSMVHVAANGNRLFECKDSFYIRFVKEKKVHDLIVAQLL